MEVSESSDRRAVASLRYLVYHIRVTNLRLIKTTYVNESVYEALERAILHGELPPRAALNDRRLAEMLGVSRTPVRDALHRLEGSGLVERRGRHGWAVAGLEPRDVEEVFELRRVLEPLGLERLAETWEEAAVRELSSFFDGFDEPLRREQYPEYLGRDHDFHKRIVACSRNSRVIGFYGILEQQIDRVRHYLSYGYEGRVEASLAEHKRICAAIGARELESAKGLLLEHLNMVEKTMVSFVESQDLERIIRERGIGE